MGRPSQTPPQRPSQRPAQRPAERPSQQHRLVRAARLLCSGASVLTRTWYVERSENTPLNTYIFIYRSIYIFIYRSIYIYIFICICLKHVWTPGTCWYTRNMLEHLEDVLRFEQHMEHVLRFSTIRQWRTSLQAPGCLRINEYVQTKRTPESN